MAGFFVYASFPNSRNKNRAPTVNANTHLRVVNNFNLPLVQVVPDNENRTYIILTNTDSTTTMRYLYPIVAPGVNPTATPTFGVTDQTLYDTTGNLLYVKLDDGFNTNWALTTPQAVAEFVLPLQSASLDTLGDIFAFADDPVLSITVAYDEGRG
jgi:hypothetical protein